MIAVGGGKLHGPYLVDLDLVRVLGLNPDVLVIGSGVAGLSAALEAAKSQSVLVLTKKLAADSGTRDAQGGIAAALTEDDSPEDHFRDTMEAGVGLCDETAVRKLVTEGVERVREIIALGANFDVEENGNYDLTREGAHSRRRILHASGDATGRELEQVLIAAVQADPNIVVMENRPVVDLLHHEGTCYGAVALDAENRSFIKVNAKATVLSTGGTGQLYRETTNPEVITGDGIAMAFRAGMEIADAEFVQFHPTTLYIAGAKRFLISESVRGEGAQLVDSDGVRFMPDIHPQAELAPRDVVSQAIIDRMRETQSPSVFLDLRHLDPEYVFGRFPNVASICDQYQIDIARELIPVRPSAHYMMGGVLTDLDGRTNVARLLACGEVACTGVHGANRLASNSLLEGLVFGRSAGEAAGETAAGANGAFPLRTIASGVERRNVPIDIDDMAMSLKSVMWRSAGIFRSGDDLAETLRELAYWGKYVLSESFDRPDGLVLQNMLTVAQLIVRGALLRRESRGAHHRSDFPERDDKGFARRIVQTIGDFGDAGAEPASAAGDEDSP